MKKFVFKYKSLLKKRQYVVDQFKQEMADLAQRMAPKQARLRHLYEQIDYVRSLITDPTGMFPHELALHDREIRMIGEERVKTEEQLRLLEDERRILQEKLTLAHREVKIIEKLKEKQWQDYQEEAKRVEMKELDEIAVVRSLLRNIPS